MWQRLKNIGLVTGPSGLFATRLVTESGALAANPPCDKPIENYSNLGPATKVGNRGGQGRPRQTPISSHSHIYVYVYIVCIYTHIYIYVFNNLFVYLFIYLFIYLHAFYRAPYYPQPKTRPT